MRSQLEYASSVWNPYKKGLIDEIEKVQRRATKLVSYCKNLAYEDRLKFLNLPTLKCRRVRGDMIHVYKILNSLYDIKVTPTFKITECLLTRRVSSAFAADTGCVAVIFYFGN